MTIAEIIAYATAHLARDDYYYDVYGTSVQTVQFVFDDFVGFGDDGSEEYREFTDEEAVDDFLAYLDEHALSVERRHRMYPEWSFDGFTVTVSYSSYDI